MSKSAEDIGCPNIPKDIEQALAKASKKVAADGDRFKFNTAIAALMTLLNELEAAPAVPREVLSAFIIMLSPFAPHLAEHLWEKLGGEGSVHKQPWPTYDPALLAASSVTVTVQVNGKRRGSISLAVDGSEEDAVAAARVLPTVVAALGGQEPNRVIYVPGKILNLVV